MGRGLEMARTREEVVQYITDLKRIPCIDCVSAGRDGYWPPECMDFDHRPDENKLGSIISLWDDEDLMQEEILKCDIICSNCHRIRTKKRGFSSKHRESIRAFAKTQHRKIETLRTALMRPDVRIKRSDSQKRRYRKHRNTKLLVNFPRRWLYDSVLRWLEDGRVHQAL